MPSALKSAVWPIEKFKPYGRNPRKNDDQVSKMVEAIREFGFRIPIVAKSDGTVVDGHLRLKAAEAMGLTECPVVLADDLTDDQVKAFRILANKSAEWAVWDTDKLLAEMQDLQENKFDLAHLGFDTVELNTLMPTDVQEDTFNLDKAVEESQNPVSKPGDIWILGDHRVMCGDSTSIPDIGRLMGGVEADLCFMDPPYNVAYKSEALGSIKNDNMSEESFCEFTVGFLEGMKRALRTGGVYYICSGYSSYPTFVWGLHTTGAIFSCPIIWIKNQPSMGWSDYHHKQEMVLRGKNKKLRKKKSTVILYGWNGGKHYFADGVFEADVWEIKRVPSQAMNHPTQKPLELIAKAVKNSSKVGESVVDLFGGAGSTLMTCQQLNRRCFQMELDPVFIDVTVKRWEAFTGETAALLKKDADNG